MTSFLVRNASTLVVSFCSLSISCACWRSKLGDLLIERAELGHDRLLALQRRAREVLVAGDERLTRLAVKLGGLLSQAVLLHLQALLRRHHLGDPALGGLQQLQLLLVAVVERLGGILGAIERRRDLRLHDRAETSLEPGHQISSACVCCVATIY